MSTKTYVVVVRVTHTRLFSKALKRVGVFEIKSLKKTYRYTR